MIGWNSEIVTSAQAVTMHIFHEKQQQGQQTQQPLEIAIISLFSQHRLNPTLPLVDSVGRRFTWSKPLKSNRLSD